MENNSVIIIGAGFAGLSAGIYAQAQFSKLPGQRRHLKLWFVLSAPAIA